MTIKEFRKLYASEYEPLLKELSQTKNKVLGGIAITGILGAIAWINFMSEGNGLLILVLSISAIGTGAQTYFTYRELREEFKQKIVKAVIAHVDPEYKYFYDAHLSYKSFIRSGLYSKEPAEVMGDDLIQGTIEDVKFEMSELRASTNSEADNSTIFHGLFIQMDWPSSFFSETYLFPDQSNDPLKEHFREKKLKRLLGDRIVIHDEKFEQKFSVYGLNESGSRAILNPEVRALLIQLQEDVYKDLHISLVGSKVYCAIAYERKLFEPALWDNSVLPGTVMEVYRLVTVVNTVVAALKPAGNGYFDIPITEPKPEIQVNPVKADVDLVSEVEDQVLPFQETLEEVAKIPVAVEDHTPTVNLKQLYYDMALDTEYPKDLELKQYLLAIIGQLKAHKGVTLTQELLTEVLVAALTTPAVPLDDNWLNIRSAPDLSIKYQNVTTAADLGDELTADDFVWKPMEFTMAVIRFQVSELHKMEGKQLDNPMKELGIASDTGTHWYNFTPEDNLEAGIQYLIDKNDTQSKLDWSIIGQIFQAGRAYE